MSERLKILEMVRDGKVSPEQAAELLHAIEGGDAGTIIESFVKINDGEQTFARRLRISTTSDKGTTSFDIPLGLIKFFHSLFPRSFKLNVNNKTLDREELMERIYSGKTEVIYREDTAKGNEVVIELA